MFSAGYVPVHLTSDSCLYLGWLWTTYMWASATPDLNHMNWQLTLQFFDNVQSGQPASLGPRPEQHTFPSTGYRRRWPQDVLFKTCQKIPTWSNWQSPAYNALPILEDFLLDIGSAWTYLILEQNTGNFFMNIVLNYFTLRKVWMQNLRKPCFVLLD